MESILDSVAERFWSKVNRNDPNGCWLWTGTKNHDGYGRFYPTRVEPMATHRFSWQIHFGSIPNGMCVCHACDNPPCVNPYHLWLGTTQANTKDRDMKGRHHRKGKGRWSYRKGGNCFCQSCDWYTGAKPRVGCSSQEHAECYRKVLDST